MSKRLTRLCLLSLLLPGLLCGCWSKREIEESGFASMLALDLTEGGEIEVAVQMEITEAFGGEGGTSTAPEEPVWIITAKGKSLAEALDRLLRYSSRRPFWAHMEAIIFGEGLARDGIAQACEYLLRNRQVRLETRVLVAEGKAKDILAVKPTITTIPARYLRQLINVSRETSVSLPRSLIDVMRSLVGDPGDQLFLPLIKLKPKEEEEGTQGGGGAEGGNGGGGQDEGKGQKQEAEAMILEGTAIFLGDKMVAKLNDLETRGLLWLRGDTTRATINVEIPDEGYAVQYQTLGRRELRVKLEDDELQAQISIFQEGDVAEHQLPAKTLDEAELERLNRHLKDTIWREVSATLNRLQELKTDVIGIGARTYRRYPAFYRQQNWPEFFSTLDIRLEIEADFRRPGETLGSPFSRPVSR